MFFRISSTCRTTASLRWSDAASGKLDSGEHIALILVRQKAGGIALPSITGQHGQARAISSSGHRALADEHAADTDVTVGRAAEPFVEHVVEFLERPGAPHLGRSSSAASAGESVSALKAEIMTETAMVTANC